MLEEDIYPCETYSLNLKYYWICYYIQDPNYNVVLLSSPIPSTYEKFIRKALFVAILSILSIFATSTFRFAHILWFGLELVEIFFMEK